MPALGERLPDQASSRMDSRCLSVNSALGSTSFILTDAIELRRRHAELL
jgi:hypothetical protein